MHVEAKIKLEKNSSREKREPSRKLKLGKIFGDGKTRQKARKKKENWEPSRVESTSLEGQKP